MAVQNFDPAWAKHLKHDPDKPLGVGVPVPSTTWEKCKLSFAAMIPDPKAIMPVGHSEEMMMNYKRHAGNALALAPLGTAPAPAVTSESWKTVKLEILGSNEKLEVAVQTSTTVEEMKNVLAWKCGQDPADISLIKKASYRTRKMYAYEEVLTHMLVKGVKSFTKQKQKYDYPKVIIGAGHIGLRTAMFYAERKEFDFVVFDRMFRVGGTSWMYQANSTSKLQTEYGAYHLGYGMPYEIPTYFTTPWPSRNALLDMFQREVDSAGIMPYIKLNTNVGYLQMPQYGKEVPVPPSLRTIKYSLTLEEMKEGRLKYGKMVAGSIDNQGETSQFDGSAIMMYPGNLTLPRMEEYKGEDEFEGDIGYAMFNEIDYHRLEGLNVTIVGHGAFAVENIRTCCEFGVHQIYLVCRRMNLACPRVCSMASNRSFIPLQNQRYMRMSEPMYELIGRDPWQYYSVKANEKRTNVNIEQKARFGIGDVYFLTIAMGKVKVHEDPEGIKRLTRHCVHLHDETKLECQGLLKLLGLVGELDIDRLMNVKEMHGFWVNGDARRYIVAEPVSVKCTQMGGTSLSPGAYSWAIQGIYMIDFPHEFDYGAKGSGMLPTHSADLSDENTPRPAYVVDARHGSMTGMIISTHTPGLQEYEGTAGFVKALRYRLCHPIRKFLAQAKEDWDQYAAKFLSEGFGKDKPYPKYPYTPKKFVEMYREHMAETGEPTLFCDQADLALVEECED